MSWEVHKFGGTSLADADCFRGVGEILKRVTSARRAVIVSAAAGVTDQLIDLAKKSVTHFSKEDMALVGDKHLKLANALGCGQLQEVFQSDISDIEDILKSVKLTKQLSEANQEVISGYGELWAAQILAGYLGCPWVDARKFLIVQPTEMGPGVIWEKSSEKLKKIISEVQSDIVIITGYIAAFSDGAPTTLKRNGSDYTAGIVANLLDAKSITIWKEVSGVMSADPKRVPEAVVLSDLSYSEAMELAFFGAKVLHPQTMAPAIQKKIPIFIKNSFDPQTAGTVIASQVPHSSEEGPVKAFSTMESVALINLEGTGMVGVPGTAERLFSALRRVGVSVILISQASSEHSICIAVSESQADKGRRAIEDAFETEIKNGLIQSIQVSPGQTILAAVGDQMSHRPGVAARMFSGLAHAGVNIRAIAQGSSERNISVVIEGKDSSRALRAVHGGFYLSDQTVSLGLIGAGLIGKTLMNQLLKQDEWLRKEYKVDFRIRGIANSKKMVLSEESIALSGAVSALEKSQTPLNIEKFTNHVQAEYIPHAAIIDCTASETVAQIYLTWLGRGIHVVTPNKKANSSSFEYYQSLHEATKSRGSAYLYETTVGAGLPVIKTLRELVQTGDRITKIEGILSGTLSFIFNSLESGQTFSQIVKKAKDQGYTEPDPRDDLSGMDVARKLVILAREAGLRVSLNDVEVTSLVPTALQKITDVAQFLSRLEEFDGEFAKKIENASRKAKKLRYVGVVENSKMKVSLSEYPADHAFCRLKMTDNIVAFTTARYKDQPLIVQGPGAGPEVTAAGVFGDLLRLSSFLGAPV